MAIAAYEKYYCRLILIYAGGLFKVGQLYRNAQNYEKEWMFIKALCPTSKTGCQPCPLQFNLADFGINEPYR